MLAKIWYFFFLSQAESETFDEKKKRKKNRKVVRLVELVRGNIFIFSNVGRKELKPINVRNHKTLNQKKHLRNNRFNSCDIIITVITKVMK